MEEFSTLIEAAGEVWLLYGEHFFGGWERTAYLGKKLKFRNESAAAAVSARIVKWPLSLSLP